MSLIFAGQKCSNTMINRSNIIDLNSYIRINSIKNEFENDCLYVTEEVDCDKICKYTNVIFETSQLKIKFFESLSARGIEYTVINCLSSIDIFEDTLFEARGLIIFDNVCCCRNNDILKRVIEFKDNKMLMC